MEIKDQKILFNTELSSLFKFDRTIKGHVRITTPFQYPDGGLIDVFIDGDFVTDFGEAFGWLTLQMNNSIWNKNEFIQDMINNYDTEFYNGQLRKLILPDRIAETVIKFGQIINNVTTHMWFTIVIPSFKTC